jgi:hypothetical protein
MSECILARGKPASTGYGQRQIGGRHYFAHRLAWEEVNGPIPEGMTVDHLCEVKMCINLDHLEIVTRAENTHRWQHRHRPPCPHGLPRWSCAECKREYQREYHRAYRAQHREELREYHRARRRNR